MKHPLLLCGALFLVGCRHPVGTYSDVSYTEADEELTPHKFTKDPRAIPLTQLTMIRDRDAAGGSYAITIDSTGSAIYMGNKHAPKTGKFVARFSKAKFDEIRDQIKKINFVDFEPYFGTAESRLPQTTISILWDGLRKSVVDRGGTVNETPKGVKDLEAMVESTMSGADWSQVSPAVQVPQFSPAYDTIPAKAH